MNWWSIYWICWLIFTVASFSVVEAAALILGQPRNTLSWNVWTFFGDEPAESPATWTFVHLSVGICLLIFFTWLAGHLVFGIWK